MCPIYATYLDHNYDDSKAELGDLLKVMQRTTPTFLSVTTDDKMRSAQAA